MSIMFAPVPRAEAIANGFKPISEQSQFAIVAISTKTGKMLKCHGWTLKELSAGIECEKRNTGNTKLREMFEKTMKMVDREEENSVVKEIAVGIDPEQAKARVDAQKEIERDIAKGEANYL